ncbi:DUF92 domain-containing protein [Effusibacillus consociatus]|uniref:DUF92 domain-containing protein n=1 Tax=Effusibacillus consociatus TaxID=1117041 RepID=A0ABV9PYI4_9BACL
MLIATVAGTAGSLFDSLLGARWQVMYRCSICGKEAERRIHCDLPTRKSRGFRILTNDVVNLVSSVAGGMVALGIGVWLR